MHSMVHMSFANTVDWMSIELPNSAPQESLTDIANQTFKLASNGKRARENDETDYAAKRIRHDVLVDTLSGILQSDYEAHREQHLAGNQKSFQDWSNQMEQLKTLKKQREDCPVTKKAIELQAQLMSAKREGRYFAWGKTPEEFKNMVNWVNAIQSSSGNEVAFAKVGPIGHENQAGIIEKLMWDIALIMGLEEVFVPTGLVYLSTESCPDQGFFAGIQPAQSGIELNDYLSDGRSIEKNNFLIASLATLLFGMFDAHSHNIIIDGEGKIHFFDNSRNLPHSNNFIERKWGSIYWVSRSIYWVSPYRSALLMFPESYKPLAKESMTEITNWVKKWSSRLPMLEKYLNSKTVKASLSKLPAHWFDVHTVLFRMKERLLSLQKCMQTDSQQTIMDIVNKVFPKYRLAYALALADALIDDIYDFSDFEYACRQVHNDVGFKSVNGLARFIADEGYSVENIRSIAMDPNLTWTQMCQEIAFLIQNIPCCDSRHLAQMKAEAEDLITRYIKPGSTLDMKDLGGD